ncbi:MAG: DUF4251 domain-containing protein [Muribaculaceae bacterium]|nr:DUF4251 domain-containing protein [Muribaculaceae bacterium]
MKTFLFSIMLILACSFYTHAQVIDDIYGDNGTSIETDQSSKNNKERKEYEKQLKMLNDSVAYKRAINALNNGHWVLLADRISLNYTAYTIPGLQNNANFVLQQGTKGMVQVALSGIDPGLNGLGGITLEGGVSGMKISNDDKGNIYYDYHISSTEINAHVFITVYGGGNDAQAVIDSTFDSSQLTLYGRLVPYMQSRH